MGDKGVKNTIQIWHNGVKEFEDGEIESSLKLLSEITGTSAKILYNTGVLFLKKNRLETAIQNFQQSVERDNHMALSHFALGITYYYLQDYNLSRQSYEKAKACLRGNSKIDYRQLGLQLVLYESEIIHNLALTYGSMMHRFEWPLEILEETLHNTMENQQRAQVQHAINCLRNGELYEPHPLSTESLFKPPKDKVDNLKDVNYLGKAKVISELNIPTNNNSISKGLQAAFSGMQTGPSPRGPSPRFGPPPTSPLPPPPTRLPDNTFRPINGKPQSSASSSNSSNNNTQDKLTFKDNLSLWHEGAVLFEAGKVNEALQEWLKISEPSAKILYNITEAQVQLGNLTGAEKTSRDVTAKDAHLAIGYFQLGVVIAKLGRYDESWKAFEKTIAVLRGHDSIDYGQLGLQCKLYKCEILLNLAWCYMNSPGMESWASEMLYEASQKKTEKRHSFIDYALDSARKGQQFPLYEISAKAIFKPPKSKIENLAKQDFLGKAKVLSELRNSNGKTTSRPATPPSHQVTPPMSSSSSPPNQSSRSHSPGPPSRPIPLPPTQTESFKNLSYGKKHLGPSSDLPLPLMKTEPSSCFQFNPDTPLPPPPLPPTPPPSSTSKSKSSPIRTLTPSPLYSPSGSPATQREGPPSIAISISPRVSPSNSPGSLSPNPLSPPLYTKPKKGGPPSRPVPPSPRTSPLISPGPSSPRSGSPQMGTQQKFSTQWMPLPPSPLSRSPSSRSPVSFLNQRRASDGVVASVPLKISGKLPKAFTEGKPNGKRQSMLVIQPYQAQNDAELSLLQGDLVVVLERDGEWIEGELRGKKGRFPSSCVKEYYKASPFN